ncbi:DUF3322 and DUF2220 domain-containing protein [Stenotrophomonas sp. MMGLT7]|uniref:Wadjet anti-phage system protein JetD domain-containing protein n=1 Tax=Stenotrophomonas sp. MMGLT7 TaxID=2901227 RepID=UPI001E51CFC5|nr:DUF3322 and DUF2220 domain-containing protein [Stenotrophomonas sp. MMGLT7]MCD7100164.1 DUF2220 family protein [Stenotrophomonas sp. MMGLT7]
MAAAAPMLLPDDALAVLRGIWRRRRGDWLLGGGEWPLPIPLRPPTQEQAEQAWTRFGQWLRAWQDEARPGTVQPRTLRWSRLGEQRLPQNWQLPDADTVADLLGEGARWRQACRRSGELRRRWPEAVALHARLPRHFDLLADLPEDDHLRLMAVLDWLQRHPRSDLFLRQLPIAGIDSKWIEPRRQVLADWLAALRGLPPGSGFERLSGLRRAPGRLRLRLLDPALRAAVGGLEDISAPIGQLAALRLPARRVVMVENLETGLAFDDLPGTVLLMARGYAVDCIERIGWLRELPLLYWGDLDTHGLVILHRLRQYAPRARTVLMDEATLLRYRALCGSEPRQHRAQRLSGLNAEEQHLYDALKRHRFGLNLRLEQERIAWDDAWPRIQTAVIAAG